METKRNCFPFTPPSHRLFTQFKLNNDNKGNTEQAILIALLLVLLILWVNNTNIRVCVFFCERAHATWYLWRLFNQIFEIIAQNTSKQKKKNIYIYNQTNWLLWNFFPFISLNGLKNSMRYMIVRRDRIETSSSLSPTGTADGWDECRMWSKWRRHQQLEYCFCRWHAIDAESTSTAPGFLSDTEETNSRMQMFRVLVYKKKEVKTLTYWYIKFTNWKVVQVKKTKTRWTIWVVASTN